MLLQGFVCGRERKLKCPKAHVCQLQLLGIADTLCGVNRSSTRRRRAVFCAFWQRRVSQPLYVQSGQRHHEHPSTRSRRCGGSGVQEVRDEALV